jgi:hypothetical protein
MNRQFTKLLIILNACFWLAVSFAIWKYTSSFPQQLVSTVIVLGALSIFANLFYWIVTVLKNKIPQRVNNWGYFVFILVSTVAQILLILFFLQ